MSAQRKDLEIADARRIAACVQACAGIPTAELEDGVLMRLIAASVHSSDPEVRAALDELRPKSREQRARDDAKPRTAGSP